MLRLRLGLGCTTLVLAMAQLVAAQDLIRYVDKSATGGNGSGVDWDNAYTSLHDALVAAEALVNGPNADRVRLNVKGDTYKPEDGGGSGTRDDTFTMRFEVRLYGGYEGVGPEPGPRDHFEFETILSGDIDPSGDDDCYHVVSSEITDTRLDGFTITGGRADSPSGNNHVGGGATWSGQTDNAIVNCLFTGNVSDGGAGGGGAALRITGDSPGLANNRFVDNDALDGRAGAVLITANDGAVFDNCLFAGNYAEEDGGAIYTFSGVTLVNCTVADNVADDDGGAIFYADGNVTIKNSIIWDNTTPQFKRGSPSEATLTITYSDVQGGAAGTGNIDADPLFSIDFGNYRLGGLGGASPCQDAGDDELAPIDSHNVDDDMDLMEETPDLDFNIRIALDAIDMGAYEAECDLFYDLNQDGFAGMPDLPILLSQWGTDPGVPPDYDANGDVGMSDVLALLVNWCAPDTHEEAVEEADLTMAEWEEFEDCLELGSAAEVDNCNCWMDHYIDVHYLETCLCAPDCPDDAPWGPHAP